eukprot:4930544-Heterocapsa_arctica.AAC.1
MWTIWSSSRKGTLKKKRSEISDRSQAEVYIYLTSSQRQERADLRSEQDRIKQFGIRPAQITKEE